MANTTKAINNPTYLGSMIAGQKYQANQGLPNEYDVDAELFGNVKKQFGGDGKPRGVDALISGLATGAEYGSKMKGIGLRKEELAKYNKIMDYFMAANMEAEKANKKNMEMEEKRQALMPYGLAGMELSYSGMPYDAVNEKMRNLFEQAQLNDPNIKGKYIGFIPNSPLLNVRDENGKDSVFSLAKIVGEDVVKRIQADWIDRQKMDVQQQGLQLQERGLGIQQQNADTSRMAVENKAKEDKAKSPEEMEKETYLRLYDLLSQEKVDPTIGAGTGIKNWVAQNVPLVGGLVGEGLAPQQEYAELLADLKGLKAKKFNLNSQSQVNKIKTLDETLPKEQAKKIVENKLKELGINIPSENKSETVKITAKDGSIWDIPKSKVDDALKRGASLAQ